MSKITKEESLQYHIGGKIGIKVTKPCKTQRDLSMAYTPGVAEPCKEISKDNLLAYKYTNKGNLVAVITDSTAVLGLGDIGDVAGKPVMEGKSVLFKAFAENREPTMADIQQAARDTVPLSKLSDQVDALRKWAKGRARPATLPEPESKQRRLIA